MKKYLLLCCCLLALSTRMSAMSTLDSLLTIYDNEVSRADYYREAHTKRIDSLCRIRPMSKEIQVRIAREYQYFQSDSARVWFLKLINAPAIARRLIRGWCSCPPLSANTERGSLSSRMSARCLTRSK